MVAGLRWGLLGIGGVDLGSLFLKSARLWEVVYNKSYRTLNEACTRED